MVANYQVTKNVELVRGDSLEIPTITFVRLDYDFTGTTAIAMVRKKTGTLVSELDCVVSGEMHKVTIDITADAADTALYPIGVNYWDLELTLPDSTVKTYVTGTFTVITDYAYA